MHETTIQYRNEAIFQSIDVSKARSLGENFCIFSGESPQSFGGEHYYSATIPSFGRYLILVTFGNDEGTSSCDQNESLDGIDSNGPIPR